MPDEGRARDQRWHDLGEFIREQRRVGHLSLRKLSELAGISNPYLSQIERGLRKPSAEILQQIARALRDLGRDALHPGRHPRGARPASADLVGEIRRDPFITEDQKQTLVRIYESFRHENGDGDERPSDGDGISTSRVAFARRRAARSPSSRCTRRPWPSPASGDSGGMNVYVRELVASLAQAGVRCSTSTSGGGPTTCPTSSTSSPASGSCTCRPGPSTCPRRRCPRSSTSSPPACSTDLAALGDVDAIHANYWLSGVAGHRLKHELDLPLVSTFHTLARVKAETGDPEPQRRVDGRGRGDRAAPTPSPPSCPAEADAARAALRRRPDRIEIVPPGRRPRLLLARRPAAAPACALGLGDRTRCCCSSAASSRSRALDVAVAGAGRARRVPTRCCSSSAVPAGPTATPSSTPAQTLVGRPRASPTGCASCRRSRTTCCRPTTAPPTSCSCPSRSESFGLVALEAAACGTPVVAAAVGGLRTLVDHGRTGFLVDGRDPDVYAAVRRRGPRRRRRWRRRWASAAAAQAARLHVVDHRRPPAPALRRPHRRAPSSSASTEHRLRRSTRARRARGAHRRAGSSASWPRTRTSPPSTAARPASAAGTCACGARRRTCSRSGSRSASARCSTRPT